MSIKYGQLLGSVVGAMILGTGLAQAAQFTTATDLSALNTVGAIFFGDAPVGAPGALNDVFVYTNSLPPPFAGAALTTSIPLAAPPGIAIDNLRVTWYAGSIAPANQIGTELVTNGSGAPVGPGPGGDGELTVGITPGITYFLVLTGTALSTFSSFTGSLTQGLAQNETPLPGALVLFGTVLAGAGAFMRRRDRMSAPAV